MYVSRFNNIRVILNTFIIIVVVVVVVVVVVHISRNF